MSARIAVAGVTLIWVLAAQGCAAVGPAVNPTDPCLGVGQVEPADQAKAWTYGDLPEATTRTAPVYPEEARAQRVDGTVMVRALVCVDGTIREVRIEKSIPLLDAAAAEAVRQWRFKPARQSGRPIAVWVPVPVRFSLH